MKRVGYTITDADLVAYADGEASGAPAAEIAAYLAETPADAARVDAWRKQTDIIRAAFQRAAAEPLPASLMLSHPRAVRPEAEARTPAAPLGEPPLRQVLRFERRRQQRNGRMVIAIIAFSAGGALALYTAALMGFGPRLPAFLQPGFSPRPAESLMLPDQSLQLARRAGEAHRTYAVAKEVQHPGEITLAQDPSLALWLSRRVGVAIRLPDFTADGLRFSGARVTPGELGPAAFLLYESASGERVGLFISRIVSDEATAPIYREDRATGTLTWSNGGAGFVLTASGGRDRLQRLWKLIPPA